jgi:hypothetical protein
MKQLKGKKTFIGIAVLAIPFAIKAFFDIEVAEGEVQSIIDQSLVVIGSVMAIYGRMDASK